MESYNIHEDQEQEEEKPNQLSDETESDVSSSSYEGLRINLTRKRSKRTRKLESFITTKKMKVMEVEVEQPHSSASDTTTEEDLAFCLMMLSRDKWKKKKKKNDKSCYEEESEEGYKMIKKGRYKCETCGKVFKSYQALGGHRASHKKNKVCNKTEFSNVVVVATTTTTKEKRIHECPICLRVFASGQALGGHKRSHGIGYGNHHQVELVKERMIDLNLPAPNEEEEVSMVFQ